MVVSSSLKVTATDVAMAHGVVVVVLVGLIVVVGAGAPPILVSPGGQAVFVAVLYGPLTDVPEQTEGTVFADGSPQDTGT